MDGAFYPDSYPGSPGSISCASGIFRVHRRHNTTRKQRCRSTMEKCACNYIGISAGSILAFLLARTYGRELIIQMFPGSRYEKLSSWAAKSNSYTALLFLGMVLPLFPDDFFCYLTGVTKMSIQKFATIIVLGKPWCILAYSILFSAVS